MYVPRVDKNKNINIVWFRTQKNANGTLLLSLRCRPSVTGLRAIKSRLFVLKSGVKQRPAVRALLWLQLRGCITRRTSLRTRTHVSVHSMAGRVIVKTPTLNPTSTVGDELGVGAGTKVNVLAYLLLRLTVFRTLTNRAARPVGVART
ncbi:hypothetical protein EVAR_67725_1 [Eumeta japonica]|uniref:Uncharacterized protein n=1 Tax=Eumeta variegata TaxID=151549 RepID=A0A4C1ZEP1_EUMVA|nr:hypothetical protein EVAR_67725_1 [Eumeta japonica]